MRIERILVQNFKTIPPAGVTITFRDGIAILVGRNNAGKSNLLQAASFVAGSQNPRRIRYQREWFQDPNQPITVEITLTGADISDAKRLGLSADRCRLLLCKNRDKSPHLLSGHITLRLTAWPWDDPDDAKDEGSDEEEPQGTSDGEAPEPGASADEPDPETSSQLAPEPETDHPKTEFVILLGAKGTVFQTERLRRRLIRSITVPAVRSHTEILSPTTWTPYGRMLREILSDSAEIETLSNLLRTTNSELQRILADEAAAVTHAAKSTAYVDSVAFQLAKGDEPLELLKTLTLAVTFANRTDDIGSVGTGTQSAIILGILEMCLRHRTTRRMRLLAVEEPELYLHPHAQRYIARLLRTLAQQTGTHVLVTTHSSDVVMGMDIRDVVRVDRPAGHSTVHQLGATSDVSSIERILSRETAEILFADTVVLTEGPSETNLLPVASRVAGTDFDVHNVSVIDVRGKGEVEKYAEFLEQLHIPWKIIVDLDALPKLKQLRTRASVTPDMDAHEQIKALLKVGVCVLSKGELEDYYPLAALAAIKGCTEEEARAGIERAKSAPSDAGVYEVVGEMLVRFTDEIAQVLPPDQRRKLVPRWYSQAAQARSSAGVTVTRKTGDALKSWMGLPKPVIARRVADWFVQNPTKIPSVLRRLARWLAGSERRDAATSTHAGPVDTAAT